MPAAAFTLPLDQVINVVTLTQCLIFAGFFWGRPAQTEISTWFLIEFQLCFRFSFSFDSA